MKFPSKEFDSAVSELCHGTVNDQTLQELHELLRSDSDARDEYIWRVEIHGELASGRLDLRGASATEQESPLISSDLPSSASNETTQTRTLIKYVLSLAAVLLCVLGGLLAWQASQSGSPESGVRVARFSGLSECRWMNSMKVIRSGDAVQQGQRIELSEGTAEIEFGSGAILTLMGPAIIEPSSSNSAHLLMGKVSVVADTPESKGFTLETLNSKFVDIGTVFAASVSPDGLSRLEVSEGAVDVVMEGAATSRLRAGESMWVEPGEKRIITRIEPGEGTAEFKFPTIEPPSEDDYADLRQGNATIRVADGQFSPKAGGKSSIKILLDGVGQNLPDAPEQSAFFDSKSAAILLDLGQDVTISRVNTYSWHQHAEIKEHRHRARQRYTLWGFLGEAAPDLTLEPEEAGWTRIARVNSDRFFEVQERLDRPSQQACSISSSTGDIGQFRYLLWEVARGTFFGEFDVYTKP